MFQVVLWDKIILRGENAMLDYRRYFKHLESFMTWTKYFMTETEFVPTCSMNTKYYFWDDGNGLVSHKNVTMTLSWNIIPNAGNLPRFEQQISLLTLVE